MGDRSEATHSQELANIKLLDDATTDVGITQFGLPIQTVISSTTTTDGSNIKFVYEFTTIHNREFFSTYRTWHLRFE